MFDTFACNLVIDSHIDILYNLSLHLSLLLDDGIDEVQENIRSIAIDSDLLVEAVAYNPALAVIGRVVLMIEYL